MWDLESIFNAKAIDTEADKALFHLDPMNEVKVEVGAVLALRRDVDPLHVDDEDEAGLSALALGARG